MSTDGAVQRDAGVDRVSNSVDSNPVFAAWRTVAKRRFLDALRQGPSTLEQALAPFSPPPPGFPPNGIGALAIGLAKAGLIVGISYERAVKGSRHAGVVRVWRLADEPLPNNTYTEPNA